MYQAYIIILLLLARTVLTYFQPAVLGATKLIIPETLEDSEKTLTEFQLLLDIKQADPEPRKAFITEIMDFNTVGRTRTHRKVW